MRANAAAPLRRHRRRRRGGPGRDHRLSRRRGRTRSGANGRLVAAMSSHRSRTLAVTGGTGFVGQHLLKMALASGYDVRALPRGWKPPDEAIAGVEDGKAVV